MAIEIPSAQLLPGAARLAELHAAELPQKDELCGSFCTFLALRAAGVDVADQDAVAYAAGGVLAPEDFDHTADLPDGERGRRDYRLQLPVTDDPAVSGVSAAGLVRAVEQLSDGSRTAIPVAGPWDGRTVSELLSLASDEQEAAVVLNMATGVLWGSHPSVPALLHYLETGDDSAGPPPDWQVGHFTGCLGAIRGTRGTLVIVADTYPSLGWNAVYLQPAERVAAALRRDHLPTDGGVLVIVPTERAGDLSSAFEAAGLTIATWDNGSPDVRA
ncbi:MAG TPA: hypothetical protein VFH74_11015 [Gaiellales bacterium]|nr:hypothetical protein [Gaiellales bacterium]